MNVVALRSWAYGEAMPLVRLGEFDLGLSPIAQWLLCCRRSRFSLRGAIPSPPPGAGAASSW
jgi:hypothetical protein